MQKKALFVAMFCGALCLTGCLKNIESESVTEVRKAHANEMNASAELLKAQATAVTTLANADAAIKQAQAELEKANAALVNAKAETEKVQAELLRVQVQLQQVKVEEEKVRLQMLKAQLEAQLAELSVAQAKAEADIAFWKAKMNQIKAEAEKQAIVAQQELLEAQHAMETYLATLEADKMAEAMPYIQAYFRICEKLVELKKESIDIEIAINNYISGTNDQIELQVDAINAMKEEIAEYQAELTYLEQYQTLTPEEIQEKLDAAYEKVNETLTAWGEAYDTYYAAQEAIEEFKENNASGYTLGWNDSFIAHFAGEVVSEPAYPFGEEIEPVFVQGVYVFNEGDEEPTFLPLWQKEQTVFEPYLYEISIETGVYNPTRAQIINKTLISPAHIYTKNIAEYLDNQKAELDEAVKDEKDNVEEWYNEKIIPDYQKNIEVYGEKVDKYAEYLSTRAESVAEAEQDLIDAVDAYNQAIADRQTATTSYVEYMVMTYDISKSKFQNVYYAKADKAQADDALVKAEAALAAEEAKVPSEEELYDAQLEAAKKEAEYKKAISVYNEGGTAAALATAEVKYSIDADGKPTGSAVTDAKTAQDNYDFALAEWRAAKVAAAANPDDPTAAAALVTATNNLNEKDAALKTANTALASAKTAYEDAKSADDDAKAIVDGAKESWDEAIKDYNDKKNFVVDPHFQTDVDNAKAAVNTAQSILEAEEDALANAFKDLDQKGVKYEDDPKFVELYEAYQEADEDLKKLGFYTYWDPEKGDYVPGAARVAYDSLYKLYWTVYNNKDNYNYDFCYVNAAYQVDPYMTYITGWRSTIIPEVGAYGYTLVREPWWKEMDENWNPILDEDGNYIPDPTNSNAYWKGYFEEMLEKVPALIEEGQVIIDETAAPLYAEIEEVREALAIYDQFEAGYDAFIKQVQTLQTDIDNANIAVIEKGWLYKDAKAEYKALEETLTDWVYSYDEDFDWEELEHPYDYAISVQAYIAYLQNEIKATNAEIDEAIKALYNFADDAEVVLQKREMDYEILIKKIDVLQQIADTYQALIEDLLGITLSPEVDNQE